MAIEFTNTPVISSINVGGEKYYIKDKELREKVQTLENSALHYLGKTTTELTDGSTTNPIQIDGENVTAKSGDVVVVESGLTNRTELEFIFNGTKWQEFGSSGTLKALAFKDDASTNYTPAGTVSQPTFTGTENQAVSVSGTPTGNITTGAATGDGNYTPSGTISTPNITVTPTVATGKLVTNAGSAASCTLPTLSTEVDENETLVISWTAGTYTDGTAPTLEDTASALTAVTAALADAPTFTGNKVDIAFTGDSLTSTGTFTAEGTVSQPTFAGTEATITVS